MDIPNLEVVTLSGKRLSLKEDLQEAVRFLEEDGCLVLKGATDLSPLESILSTDQGSLDSVRKNIVLNDAVKALLFSARDDDFRITSYQVHKFNTKMGGTGLSSVHTHHSSKTSSTRSLRVLLQKDTVLSLSIVLLPIGSSLLQDQSPTEKDTADQILCLVTQTTILSPGDLPNRRRIWSINRMLIDSFSHRHLPLSSHVRIEQMRRTAHRYLGTAHQSRHRISVVPLLVRVERALLKTPVTETITLLRTISTCVLSMKNFR